MAKRMVDGSWLTFRAFFAIPATFRTTPNLQTNAVYGFAAMFRKLLAGKTSDYCAVVFDAQEPTFREEKMAKSERVTISTCVVFMRRFSYGPSPAIERGLTLWRDLGPG